MRVMALPCEERRASARRRFASGEPLSMELWLNKRLEVSCDEIKRLVELLLTTEDLRAVQSLTVRIQQALYSHKGEIQTELAEPRPRCCDRSPVLEVSVSTTSDGPVIWNIDRTTLSAG